MTQIRTPGLTGFQLKLLALALMVLDHIYYFFSFTGGVPLALSMAGRLSAPLFLFCTAEGFAHTHNRRAYGLRCWAIGAAMGAANYAIALLGLARPDGFVPANNIFATFALLTLLWQGMDWLSQRRWGPGLAALLLPFAMTAAYFGLLMLPGLRGTAWVGTAYLLQATLLPLPLCTEGGLPFLVSGLLMYALRNSRGLQAAVFVWINLLWNVFAVWAAAGGEWKLLFTDYYEWMCVFAAPLMLLYNGRRGRSLKALFYLFYPAHVYLLFAASCLLFAAAP